MKKKHWKYIRRALLALVPVYACLALLPYVFVPKMPVLSDSWQDALTSDTNADRGTILETGDEALLMRLKVIANAKESIRAGTYLYAMDESGEKISAALLSAADRGVKVELLIDGLIGTINAGNDPMLRALGSHENITVKRYDPVNLFNPAGLNACYHEKYFIVDDEYLILGGRNISDEFLTAESAPAYNYDLDIMIHHEDTQKTGAVQQVAEYFDTLFSEPYCTVSFTETSEKITKKQSSLREKWAEMQEQYDLSPIDPQTDMVPVEKTVLMTNPTNTGAKEPLLFAELCALMQGAQERVILQTPYLVMNGAMKNALDAAAGTKSDMSVLLNSRASGNNVIASADYVFQKGTIARMDWTLCELQTAHSMHTKAILVDDSLSVFGSFNFDIRSAYIDTEIMLAVYSPEINQQLETYMQSFTDSSLQVTAQAAYAPSSTLAPAQTATAKNIFILLLSPFLLLFRFLA